MSATAFDEPRVPTRFGPLDPAQVADLERAQKRAAKLRRVARVASLSGWTTLLFGLLALPFGLTSGVALALGLALVAVGYRELTLRSHLLRLDLAAPRALAVNQILLALVVCGYAGLQLAGHTPGQGAISTALANEPSLAGDPATERILQSVTGVENMIIWGVYGSLIAGTVVMQGLTARYYASRTRVLSDYLAETPGWVLELNRRGLLS
jgi:hypothetical protein